MLDWEVAVVNFYMYFENDKFLDSRCHDNNVYLVMVYYFHDLKPAMYGYVIVWILECDIEFVFIS